MNSANWIALAAVMITTFGMIVAGGIAIIRLMIKSSSDDLELKELRREIERRDDKIESLRGQIREMN